jgi:hypothetical protein
MISHRRDHHARRDDALALTIGEARGGAPEPAPIVGLADDTS